MIREWGGVGRELQRIKAQRYILLGVPLYIPLVVEMRSGKYVRNFLAYGIVSLLMMVTQAFPPVSFRKYLNVVLNISIEEGESLTLK